MRMSRGTRRLLGALTGGLVAGALVHGLAHAPGEEPRIEKAADAIVLQGAPTLRGAPPRTDVTAEAPNRFRKVRDLRTLIAAVRGRRPHGKDARTRLQALAAVDSRVAPALVALLREEHDAEWRQGPEGWQLEDVYAAIEAVGAACRGPLEALLREGPAIHELRAALALRGLREQARQSVPLLLAYAQDRERSALVRTHMIEALGRAGPAAKAALPWLASVIEARSEQLDLRLVILDAIVRIRGTDAETFVMFRRILQRDGDAERGRVLRLLSEAGPEAAALAPDIVKAMTEADGLVEAGIQSLERLQPGTERVVQLLEEHLVDDYAPRSTRLAALGALATQGARGRAALWRSWDQVDETYEGELFRLLAEDPPESERERLWTLGWRGIQTSRRPLSARSCQVLFGLRPAAARWFEPIMELVDQRIEARRGAHDLVGLLLNLEGLTEQHRLRIRGLLTAKRHGRCLLNALTWSPSAHEQAFLLDVPNWLTRDLLAVGTKLRASAIEIWMHVLARLVVAYPAEVVAAVKNHLSIQPTPADLSGYVQVAPNDWLAQGLRLLDQAGPHGRSALPELRRLMADLETAMQTVPEHRRNSWRNEAEAVRQLIIRLKQQD